MKDLHSDDRLSLEAVDARAAFETVTSIHIYSLQPHDLKVGLAVYIS